MSRIQDRVDARSLVSVKIFSALDLAAAAAIDEESSEIGPIICA
jgi:hypothetical protein